MRPAKLTRTLLTVAAVAYGYYGLLPLKGLRSPSSLSLYPKATDRDSLAPSWDHHLPEREAGVGMFWSTLSGVLWKSFRVSPVSTADTPPLPNIRGIARSDHVLRGLFPKSGAVETKLPHHQRLSAGGPAWILRAERLYRPHWEQHARAWDRRSGPSWPCSHVSVANFYPCHAPRS